MTLDEYQREVSEAIAELKEKLTVTIEKAVAAGLDGTICVTIIEREFEKGLSP